MLFYLPQHHCQSPKWNKLIRSIIANVRPHVIHGRWRWWENISDKLKGSFKFQCNLENRYWQNEHCHIFLFHYIFMWSHLFSFHNPFSLSLPPGHFSCINQSLSLVAGMVCGFDWMWPQSRENGACEHLISDGLQHFHHYSFHKPHWAPSHGWCHTHRSHELLVILQSLTSWRIDSMCSSVF